MNISIHSRQSISELISSGAFPDNTAVISFHSPKKSSTDADPVDYRGLPARLFYVCAPDIDIEALPRFSLTYETYLGEARALADFIRNAVADGLSIICQCEYGQSRSAACCAAILEYYERSGITVFADYRYYPNQMVFHKIFDALKCEN